VQEKHGYEKESTLYTEVHTVSNSRIDKQASEIIGTLHIQPSENYNIINTDLSHSLYCFFFKLLPSGLELIWQNKNKKRLYNYFIPTAISIFNKVKCYIKLYLLCIYLFMFKGVLY